MKVIKNTILVISSFIFVFIVFEFTLRILGEKVDKDKEGEYIVLESGVGSDFNFTDRYSVLPLNPKTEIYTWYISEEWEVDKIEEKGNELQV